MASTTKYISYNTTDNEVIVFGSGGVLADHLNTNWYNLEKWFKKTKVVHKEHNNCHYILYKADKFIKKKYPKGWIRKKDQPGLNDGIFS